jgi:hypothetical protein
MKIERLFAALLIGCCFSGAARAQMYGSPANGDGGYAVPTGNGHYDVPGISNWIRRDHDCGCQGPTGGNGDIGYDAYFRAGPSLPLEWGKAVVARNTHTGFTVEGGFRTLFFNVDNTRAWFLDLGIGDSYNPGGGNPHEQFTLNVLVPVNGVATRMNVNVGIKNVNRSFVNFGGGREWFFGGDGTAGCPHWRYSIDMGGRWGTESMEVDNTLRHRTDVIGGVYAGSQLSYEFPCYDLLWSVGIRTEWAYTWSDILQRASDMNEINLLFNLGVRF